MIFSKQKIAVYTSAVLQAVTLASSKAIATLKIMMAIFLGSILLLTSGCSLNDFRTEAASVSQLVFASPSNPTTFNPPLNDSLFSRVVFSLIFDSLIVENGETAELEPALAESWEISEDNQTVTFTLRPDLKWADGEPFTVDDIVFTYNDIYYNEEIPTGIRDILRIGESGQFPTVTKISDRQVQFRTPEPFAPFLRYVGGITILPKHILERSTQVRASDGKLLYLAKWGTDTDPREIIGNGPYRMTGYSPSQRIVFERNPNYWRRDTEGQPQPYIERIIVQIIPSDDTSLITFLSGNIDNIEVKPEQFRLVKLREDEGNYTIYNAGPAAESRNVSFNLNKASTEDGEPLVDPVKSRWFNTLAFRQAVAYAVNRQAMLDSTYQGLGAVQHSPIWIESPFYLSPEEGLKTYNYDPEKAKELLTSAGFQYNSLGQLEDWDGNRVRFTILVKAEEKTRVDAAVQIQQDLANIGIQGDLQVLSFNTILQKLLTRQWECYVGGFGGGGIDPHSSFNIWNSHGSLHQFNQGPLPGTPDIQGWEVSDWEREIDRLFLAGATTLDESKRKEIYAEFQQIAAQQVPFLYLINSLSLDAVSNNVTNIRFTPYGGAFWNLYELKVEAK